MPRLKAELSRKAEAEVVARGYDVETIADVPSESRGEMSVTERKERMQSRLEQKGASAVRRNAMHSEGHLECCVHSKTWALIHA